MRNTILSFSFLAIFLISASAVAQDKVRPESKKATGQAGAKATDYGLVITANSDANQTTMSRADLAAAVFKISSVNPVADSGLEITSFKIKYPGQPVIEASGNTLKGQARTSLDKAKAGDQIVLFDAVNAKGYSVGNLIVTLKD